MKKSIRSAAAVATLALSMTPALYANQTGCNPHPQAQTTNTWAVAAAVMMTLFGM